MQDKLINYISQEFYTGEAVEADTDLLDDGLIDSIGFMKIIQFMEDELGTKVEPQDMVVDHFMTVAAMTAYIESKK